MNQQQLATFLAKHKLTDTTLAELLGLTPSAVNHWMVGRRTIAKPYGRLLRMFDKYPQLMKEFK